jgi:hypothetical protein
VTAREGTEWGTRRTGSLSVERTRILLLENHDSPSPSQLLPSWERHTGPIPPQFPQGAKPNGEPGGQRHMTRFNV